MNRFVLTFCLVGTVGGLAQPVMAQSLPGLPPTALPSVAVPNANVNSAIYGELSPRGEAILNGFPQLMDSLQIFVPPANSPVQNWNLNPTPQPVANPGSGVQRRTLSEILLLDAAPIPAFAR